MNALPEYTDGCFELYRIIEKKDGDYAEEVIQKENMAPICYREISVFDTTRVNLEAAGVIVTMKIRIPRYKGINSRCVCMIDGIQNEVYNATHIVDKNGFPETELTLRTPTVEREVLND